MHTTAQRARGLGLAALLTLAAALPGTALADREVFQWTDSEGNVIFSDTPPASDASTVVVRTSPTRPLGAHASRSEPAAQTPAAEADDEDGRATQREAAELQALRQRNCERSRGNLNTLETSRRVYEPLPNGERRYLTEDEVNARKAEAQADIQRWCS